MELGSWENTCQVPLEGAGPGCSSLQDPTCPQNANMSVLRETGRASSLGEPGGRGDRADFWTMWHQKGGKQPVQSGITNPAELGAEGSFAANPQTNSSPLLGQLSSCVPLSGTPRSHGGGTSPGSGTLTFPGDWPRGQRGPDTSRILLGEEQIKFVPFKST